MTGEKEIQSRTPYSQKHAIANCSCRLVNANEGIRLRVGRGSIFSDPTRPTQNLTRSDPTHVLELMSDP